jgi:hypothetical protein
VKYAYRCPRDGVIENEVAQDAIQCRCGQKAKRVWSVSFDRNSTKQSGRWDPQVGQYVANDREFQELLRQGAEKQSQELGMECKLTTIDARDIEGRGELHGTGVDHVLAEAENTARRKHDEAAAANRESKAKRKIETPVSACAKRTPGSSGPIEISLCGRRRSTSPPCSGTRSLW